MSNNQPSPNRSTINSEPDKAPMPEQLSTTKKSNA